MAPYKKALSCYKREGGRAGSLNAPSGRELRYVLVPPGYQGQKIPDGYDYVVYYTTPLVRLLL